MMGHVPGALTSPWVYESMDYADHIIRLTVTFDTTTKALEGASVYRDPECVYTKAYFGVGSDGRPDTTLHAVRVPAGTTNLTAGQLAAVGFTTIDDILKLQITTGP